MPLSYFDGHARHEFFVVEIDVVEVHGSETQKEIVNIEAKLAELREREVAARDRLSRMGFRAPVDGFVYDLQIHTVGGVIAPGATVMSIVHDAIEHQAADVIGKLRQVDAVGPGVRR